ncbi:glycosyltransferase, partial [Agromyces binzhouensis]
YGALAARLSGVPLVVHLRDLVEPEALGGAGHAIMTRVVLPRADGVIANSRATLDAARPHLSGDAVVEVVPSASGLVLGADRPLAADAPLRTVGMLARIDPWKGQLELLEAFARAFHGRDIRLQFAGGAPFGHEAYLAELRHRADELGIGAQVDVLGHVDDVPRLLAGWDVAVQYSTRPEPLGQNVLQYLAAGRAVIAAGEGGPIEWVADGANGLLVPPRDVDALAGALRRLDGDPALR